MRKIYVLLVALMLTIAATAQTLNVTEGQVTYLFPASQCGDMTFTNGETVTIMGKEFTLSDVSMKIDATSVTDGSISVAYDGSETTVVVAGNIAQYVTPTISGAHVSIAQSDNLAEEITYTLTGTSTDGEFYMSGSYKATVELNGLTLTNATPVYSGAAVHVQNGKRIKVKVVTGTTNTLVDAASGSQKGCLYVKGHAEFAQKGTLNITGNVKHGIKTGEYMTLKNATINVLSSVTADAAKGIKSEGDMMVSGGNITIKTTGGGLWDSSKLKTKASSCLSADGNMTISGGTLTLTSTGAGGKGLNVDGALTMTGGTTTISTSGNAVVASSSGTLSVATSSNQLDSYDSDYKSSPKGIKVDGALTISDDAIISVTTTGAGGEGIESKTYINITGGQTTIVAADDAINASYNDDTKSMTGAGDFTITGGYLYAQSTGNDGIDANGNCYIKGGVVYAIGTGGVEKSIDANTEENKKLFITGGTIIAVGDLEGGSSISGGTCKYTTSWNGTSWYALYNGGTLVAAFKTPAKSSSGGGGGGWSGPGGGGSSQKLIVYTSSTPTLQSGVSVSGGTEYFNGMANIGGTVSNGSSVSLSNYSSSSGGGPGGW